MTGVSQVVWLGSDGPAPPPLTAGGARHYELAHADATLASGPRRLTVVEGAVRGDALGDDVSWHLEWRELAVFGQVPPEHAAILIVGMDPAPGSDAEQLAEFDEFYTSVHLPGVVDSGGYASGTRYELRRRLRYPRPHAPRFCAVYEADAAATERKLAALAAGGGPRPAASGGPVAWAGRKTAWRLFYRRCER